jgi:hypothetical protein
MCRYARKYSGRGKPLALLALLVLVGLFPGRLLADRLRCDICGAPIGAMVYTVQDTITGEKKQICSDCMLLGKTCFVCGLPTRTNYVELPDGRVLCERDAETAMLDEEQAGQLCRETRDQLDRLFSRFLAFPETNVTVSVIDRIHLQELFKFAGHDYVCPNVWGYVETRSKYGHFEHAMSLLSGLPRSAFAATCAHEYTHTWLNENLSEARKQTLSRDADEGFCELVSYLLMAAQNEEGQKKQILANAYTRGQIHLLIAAEKRYGFSDVMDWMKFGTDDRLHADDLGRIRSVEVPQPKVVTLTKFPVYKREPAPTPKTLVLKGITWAQNQPLALINDRTFAPEEQGKVRVGQTNLTIRCLAIAADAVRIRLVGSGQEEELRLRDEAQ